MGTTTERIRRLAADELLERDRDKRSGRTVLLQLAREVDAARVLIAAAPITDPAGRLYGTEWRARADVLESLALCRATLEDALHALESSMAVTS